MKLRTFLTWTFLVGRLLKGITALDVHRHLQTTIDGNLAVAISVTRLDRFLVFLAFTDEEQVLSDPSESSTVFGPTDAVLETQEFTRLDILGFRQLHLPYFIQTHLIADAALRLDTLPDGITTKSGEQFNVSRDAATGSVTLSNSLGTALIETANIQAGNGILHVVQDVLRPTFTGRTVGDLPSNRYSLFVELVVLAEYDQVLGDVDVQTVLAPLNAAIEALPDGIWDRIRKLPDYADELVSIHLVSNIYTIQDLRETNELLVGNQAPFFLWKIQPEGSASVRVNGFALSETDILAYNGISHGMDGIFLPRGGPPTDQPSESPSAKPSNAPSTRPTFSPSTAAPTLTPSSGTDRPCFLIFAAIMATAFFHCL